MLLKRLMRKLRARKDARSRMIFTYETGNGKRHADPMAIALALKHDKRFLPEHLEQAKNLDAAAMEIVAQATEKAFRVKRLDENSGKGLTISQLVGLLDAFDLWCFQLQKKTKC